jgi:hypothetical protein
LFDPATAEAVIVGRGEAPEELRARQVQELVKLGRPALAIHPLFDSVLSYFEVDMARGESGCVLDHYNPLAEVPVAQLMDNWIRDGHPELGAVEQVVATRTLSDRSRSRVLWHFERDVELLDHIAGPLDKLGAHAADGDADYSALSVQLSGQRRVPVRWAVEPPSSRPELHVTLICADGRFHATLDAEARTVHLTEQRAGQTTDAGTIEWDAARSVVERFAADVSSGRADSTWPAALRAMELADTIEIALRRGRMIDVHHQELTEQLAFKGTMAAVGCGVLAAVVPVVLAAALFAGQFGAPVGQFVPHLLLGILALFLLLQLLPRLLYGKPPQRDAPASEDDGSS